MEAREAFARLWSKINNPRSACPDVEIGRVQDEMIAILMEGLEGSEEERWILARLSFGSYDFQSLLFSWGSRAADALAAECPGWEADEATHAAYYDREERVGSEARKALGETINRLLAEGRVLLRDRTLTLP